MSELANVLTPLQLSSDFLWLAIVFFVGAVVAGIAGLRDVAGISMRIAKIAVVIFLVLAVVTFLL